MSQDSTARRPLALIGLAALAGIVLRLHFLLVPLTTDEGGYAAIARLWGQGHRLYGDVAWVDRPQGLVLLYRLAGLRDGTAGVRTLAIVAAAITLGAVATAAWALAGPRAAVAAAWLYALASPAPHHEGFTANGELLAGAFSATGVALALLWRRAPSERLLLAAAIAAGAAPMVKQSAFDGAAVVVAIVILSERRVGRALALAAAGIAVPTLLAVLHGAATGLSDWWYAIVSYHTTTESLLAGDHSSQLHLLGRSLRPLGRDAAALLVAALAGLVVARASIVGRIAPVWICAVLAGVAGGGLFHPHYWIALLPPLAVLAGIAIARLGHRAPWAVLAVVAGAILPARNVYSTTVPDQISARSSADTRILTARAVGDALQAASPAGGRVLALWANASVYWYADRVPASRYLWHRNLELIAGAVPAIVAEVTGSRPPAAIAVYQSPGSLDPSGAVERALATRYVRVAAIDGIPVYRLR